MGSDNTSLSKSTEEQLEVRFLEQTFGWAFWVGRICDDYIELILIVVQEFEAIADMGSHLRVLKTNRHSREILL